MDEFVYKVVSKQLWSQAVADRKFSGAEIDLQDGFIHFSALRQLKETVSKHFAGRDDLLLVAVDPESLGDLRWESSRGGDLFPHLYDDLDPELAIHVDELLLADDGDHRYPDYVDVALAREK